MSDKVVKKTNRILEYGSHTVKDEKIKKIKKKIGRVTIKNKGTQYMYQKLNLTWGEKLKNKKQPRGKHIQGRGERGLAPTAKLRTGGGPHAQKQGGGPVQTGSTNQTFRKL